jgi:hypothetical protein
MTYELWPLYALTVAGGYYILIHSINWRHYIYV